MKNGYEKSFADECKNTKRSLNNLFCEFKKNPEDKEFALQIMRDFEKLQRSAEFLECENLERLFNAATKVFSSVYEGYIFYSKRLERLLILIEKNLDLSLAQIVETGIDSIDVDKTIEFCDRVSAGELVDFSGFFDEEQENKEIFSEWTEKALQINSIPTVEIERSKLIELFNNLDNFISKTFIIEKEVDSGNVRNIKTYCGNLRAEIEDMRDEIENLHMLPFSTICEELKDKYKNVNFDRSVYKIRLDSTVLTTLVQVLPVFFQNNHNTIKISAVLEKYETVFTIIDPSMKIDFEGIRNRALKLFPERSRQIVNASEKELSAFLFLKAFSSNSKLNSVLNLMDKVRGKVYVQNQEGGGTKSVLIFPNSLSTRRGLFVKAGTKTFFIPSNHVQDIISKWRSELFVEQNQHYVNFENEKIPVYSLSSLLQEKASDKGIINLLIIEYLEMKVAIEIDEVSSYSSVTFRALPSAFKNFNMLLGVAIDNEHRMIPILNTIELLVRLRGMRGFEMKKMEVFSRIDKPKILVVDDSDTSREIEGSILQANGFAVDEAADGILAMEKLKETKYDVIVTDTEMPRMNGLMFLENVRLLENYKAVPVIVIIPNNDDLLSKTYREAGASAFLNKNDFKRSNLIKMVKNFLNNGSL